MTRSNALTVPFALLLSCTLSVRAIGLTNNAVSAFSYIESSYQTTSINSIAEEFSVINPKADALDLFGVQSYFSPDEQKTYWKMLELNSEKVGINIFDLFE